MITLIVPWKKSTRLKYKKNILSSHLLLLELEEDYAWHIDFWRNSLLSALEKAHSLWISARELEIVEIRRQLHCIDGIHEDRIPIFRRPFRIAIEGIPMKDTIVQHRPFPNHPVILSQTSPFGLNEAFCFYTPRLWRICGSRTIGVGP